MDFSELEGKTILSIERKEDGGNEELYFRCSNGHTYVMRHDQDCCESVYIEDIVGDLEDLLNTPILYASERTNSDNPKGDGEYRDESFTWTFYNISTMKGHVTIRWYGTSNGYYSESVSFYDASKSRWE